MAAACLFMKSMDLVSLPDARSFPSVMVMPQLIPKSTLTICITGGKECFAKPGVVILQYTSQLASKESLVAAGREFYFGCGLIICARLSATSQSSFGEWLPAYRRQKCDSRLYTQGGNREDFGGVNIRPRRAFLLLFLYWCLSCLYLPVPDPFYPTVKQLDLFL